MNDANCLEHVVFVGQAAAAAAAAATATIWDVAVRQQSASHTAALLLDSSHESGAAVQQYSWNFVGNGSNQSSVVVYDLAVYLDFLVEKCHTTLKTLESIKPLAIAFAAQNDGNKPHKQQTTQPHNTTTTTNHSNNNNNKPQQQQTQQEQQQRQHQPSCSISWNGFRLNK